MTMRQWLIDELADLPEYRPGTGTIFQLAWSEDSFVLCLDGQDVKPPPVQPELFARRSVGWMEGRRQYFFAYTILLIAANADLAHWFALRFADELFGSVHPISSMTFGVPYVRAWLAAQLEPAGTRKGVLHIDYDDGTAETLPIG